VNSAEQILPLTETVTPADQAEVAEAVRAACRSGTPIYPIGGGTRLRYGVRPSGPGLGLSLGRVNGVVDYPARDLTITVEAGITIAQLQDRLASKRQRLPVDVPRADRATMAGVVATCPSGPRRYRCGTMRDYVIGIRAVDGRGTTFSGGGRVVKNAAGYDLCRLLTGSLGTLGVIIQVSLMVEPMPETSAMLACDVADYDMAERLLADLMHTETLPTAIEFLAGPAWQDDGVLSAGSASGVGRLVVGFEGTAADVEWMIERLEAQWRRSPGVSTTAFRGDRCTRIWQRLVEFPAETWGAAGTASLVVQIAVLPRATTDFLRRLFQLDPDCSVQAHAGNGIIQVRFSHEPQETFAALGGQLRPAVTAAGGSMVVLCWPDGLPLGRNDVWGPPAGGADVMQAIKSRFDPKGILNPGRFIYGSP
jgi:glycolate oxidase FAD binding subunit